MNILVLTDNAFLLERLIKKTNEEIFSQFKFDFYCSKSNPNMLIEYNNNDLKTIDVNDSMEYIISKYELIISLHCKQLFPKKIVDTVRCINVHPGLNPYNRGWFPQVFSIINKLPIGVTIHEMDEYLDHGGIIIQEEVKINDYETSYDVYKKIQELEIELLEKNLIRIIMNDYTKFEPIDEGNINLKKDFNKLCKIDLNKKVTYREAIDFFRAMSFKGYRNAYFYDENGDKIFVEIELAKECE